MIFIYRFIDSVKLFKMCLLLILFIQVIKKNVSTNYGTIRTLYGQALKTIMKCY